MEQRTVRPRQSAAAFPPTHGATRPASLEVHHLSPARCAVSIPHTLPDPMATRFDRETPRWRLAQRGSGLQQQNRRNGGVVPAAFQTLVNPTKPPQLRQFGRDPPRLIFRKKRGHQRNSNHLQQEQRRIEITQLMRLGKRYVDDVVESAEE